jgi:cell division protein FtsZ
MEGADGVLLSIYGGSDLGLFEINEAASLVAEAAHPDANIIFGAVIDDTLGDEVKVTVIAAGFDSGQLPYKKVDIKREPAAQARTGAPAPVGAAAPTNPPAPPTGAPTVPAAQPATAAGDPAGGAGFSAPTTVRPNGSRPVVEDDLDVPDFLK